VKATLFFAYTGIAAVAAALALLALPEPVSPANGSYAIVGGTAEQRLEVRRALAASSFDWHIVPQVITIRITHDSSTSARLGEIRLSAELLDSGRASWGIVQHEFAHQVDFYLLDDTVRLRLARALGAKASWWPSRAPGLGHRAYACERFASTLAWAYWPSRHNVLRPRSRRDEAAAMQPARFRALLAELLADNSLARPTG
jgi:hypothetical protein